MKKNILTISLLLLLTIFFSFTSVYATNSIQNDIKTPINKVENTAENVTQNTAGAIKNGIYEKNMPV